MIDCENRKTGKSKREKETEKEQSERITQLCRQEAELRSSCEVSFMFAAGHRPKSYGIIHEENKRFATFLTFNLIPA
jgi:hypothetical protein